MANLYRSCTWSVIMFMTRSQTYSVNDAIVRYMAQQCQHVLKFLSMSFKDLLLVQPRTSSMQPTYDSTISSTKLSNFLMILFLSFRPRVFTPVKTSLNMLVKCWTGRNNLSRNCAKSKNASPEHVGFVARQLSWIVRSMELNGCSRRHHRQPAYNDWLYIIIIIIIILL